MNHVKMFVLVLALAAISILAGCDESTRTPTADEIQHAQQASTLRDGAAAVGTPNIINHREMRELKDIYEKRDQEGLLTYTYTQSEMTGKLVFLGKSIGYGIPAATQFNNPQYIAKENTYQSGSYAILPQAEPNGLFSPASAEGTWVMLIDPANGKPHAVYVEPKIVVSTFPLQ